MSFHHLSLKQLGEQKVEQTGSILSLWHCCREAVGMTCTGTVKSHVEKKALETAQIGAVS
jgi:hypothetical protein